MALTEIEYGSLASSEILNNNFQYLDNKLNNLSETFISNNAGIDSNIASINSTISKYNDETNKNLDTINTNYNNMLTSLSSSGIYTNLYVNGSSWYKEYFSNPEKTNRVWLEQGGRTTTLKTLTFLKNFINTNYAVFAQRTSDTYEYSIVINQKTVNSCYIDCRAYGNAARNCGTDWYACGV